MAVVTTSALENVQMAALCSYLASGLQVKDKGSSERILCDPFLKRLCSLLEPGIDRVQACLKVILCMVGLLQFP